MAAATDLTNLAQVKQWLGVKAGTEDALLAQLLSSASVFFLSKVNRALFQASYTEVRDGLGTDSLLFMNYPVTSVSALLVNGLAVVPSPGYGQTGYVFSDTAIYLTTDIFTIGRRNVSISYVAGYNGIGNVPLDIQEAVCELVAYKYKERDRIGHSSKTITGETVAYITKDMPDGVASVVQQYKRVAPI